MGRDHGAVAREPGRSDDAAWAYSFANKERPG